ncbi:hypothetical protein ACWCRF_28385 [Streptomyces sp. NPDC002405]|uniref:hypothetical protein n=1 Tax=unclassified Streptomyces TaxID=2593676 RepID=UPI0036812E70
MTAPEFPCEPPPFAGPRTAAMRRPPVTGGRRGAGSPDDPRERAFATHRPCPVDGCPAPARGPVRPLVNPPALDRGGLGHDTVPCTRCGARRGVSGEDVAPNTGEDIEAPPPHEAYANAPDLRREMHQVLALGAERDGRQARTVTGPPVDAAVAERVRLLRRAALMDRMALESPDPGPVGAATQTAEQLLRYDRRRPDLVAGPYQPDAITLGPSRRRYVRQEYAAWASAGRPGA